jgi:predicted aspartyl protease
MRTAYLLAALPLTCLCATDAFAQACNKPLALSNELQMESTDGGPSSIPVKLNGTDQKLTLATAGTTTQISEDTAKALKLETRRSDITLPDFVGNPAKVDEVTIADFSMGRLHGTNVKWPISPQGGFGGRGGGGARAGLFSLNYMRLYDVDADFGSDKLRFFSQDHCPGAVQYWTATGPAGVLPITIDNGRVTVPVMVNGKAIKGVIDTAAPSSSVRRVVAERVLGVELGGPKAPLAPGGFGGQNYALTADTLTFGPLKLENITFSVRPDINADGGKDPAMAQRLKKAGIDFEMANPEVVIGMDTLRKLHIYLAFGENKLYVTGTTSTHPVAAAAPAKAP